MADGTELSWTRRGSGTPVVLVHGITESTSTWDPIAARLEDRFDVVAVDLRGHGRSGLSNDYGLEAMAGDVAAVIEMIGMDRPHLVGHSLGGAVVSATGSMVPVASVTNVDQSLRLGQFKEQIVSVEGMLRDPEVFPTVVSALFDEMIGPRIDETERTRINAARRADQDVVLGVWRLLLESPVEEVDAAVDAALAGYSGSAVPYLSLFGSDPGDDYAAWLNARIPGSSVEIWADHGHYPHLVDPDRFSDRLSGFWNSTDR